MNAQASILSRRVVVAAAPNSSARRSPLPPPDPGHGAAAGPPVNVTRPSASARTSTDSFTSRNSSRTSSIQTGHAGSRAPVARYESRTPYAISGTASIHASVTSFATSSHRPSLDSVESRDVQSSSIRGQRSFRNALKRTKRQVLKIPPSDINALKEEIKLRHKLGGFHLRDYDWLVERITSVSRTRLGCFPNTAAPQRNAAMIRSLEDMLRQNVEATFIEACSEARRRSSGTTALHIQCYCLQIMESYHWLSDADLSTKWTAFNTRYAQANLPAGMSREDILERVASQFDKKYAEERNRERRRLGLREQSLV